MDQIEHQYIKCVWLHDHDDEPFELYAQIDEDRFEVRKIFFFKDGRKEIGSIDDDYSEILSEVPWDELDMFNDLNKKPSPDRIFALYISREEFEFYWQLVKNL